MSRLALACVLVVACAKAPEKRPIAEAPRAPLKFTDVSPAEPPYALEVVAGAEEPIVTSGFFVGNELVLSGPAGGRTYVFSPETGRFVPRAPEQRFPGNVNLLVDLDGDGAPDAFSGRGGVEIAWGLHVAQPPFLFRDAGWTSTGNVTLADVDGDGWTDIVGAGSCCGEAHCEDLGVALRTGPRTFERLGGLPSGPRIRSYLGTLVNTGTERFLAQLGDPCDGAFGQPATFRLSGSDARGRPVFEAFDPFPANATFREGDPHRTLTDAAPMAIGTADFDGDGLFDLFVSTNPYHAFFRADFADVSAGSNVLRIPGDPHFQIPWGAVAADLDFDGATDLVVVHGDDQNSRTKPEWHVGPQGVDFFRNLGNFRFEDLAAEAALEAGQYRTLAAADFDCDGDADLVAGRLDAWPRVWRNESPGKMGVSVKVEAADGTPAPGARVDVEAGGKTQHLVAGGFAGPVIFTEAWAFGAAEGAARVRVTWPSGLSGEVSPEGGKCTAVREPVVWTIAPESRVAAAGTAFRVTRAEAGATIRAVVGMAEIQAVSGGFDVRSDSAGEVVLEASVNGVALPVRPRLTWTPP